VYTGLLVQPRPSEPNMPLDDFSEIHSSTCPHDCPSGCALDVQLVEPGRVGRVRGAAHPYVGGVICAKVARYAERVHSPDRLTAPLKRIGPKGSGSFTPISWDEALDTVAEAFRKAETDFGPESIWPYLYAGTMGFVQRDGIERLRRVMGWSKQKRTICSTLASSGWLAGVGGKIGTDPREMEKADLIVVWGGNPVNTQVHVMNWIAKARKARGAKLVVIDPYRTGTAEKADLHLMPRPGTDAALACAVMHVLFAEGFADRAWMNAHTDAPRDLDGHVAERTPAWAEEITGIPAGDIIEFARLYGSTKRSFLRIGYGFTRSRNGAASMHAVTCLPSVTGAWAHEGGGALQSVSGAVLGFELALIDGSDLPPSSARTIDMCRIGPALTGDVRDLGEGPPVKAMIVQNSNPAVVAPESLKVREGLSRDDLFLCVHEQFLTDTARYADIVLPATTFLEHEDMYSTYGHYSVQVARRVIPPQGKARCNHEVICGLAERLGVADRHEGFRLPVWDIIDRTLKASGLPSADDLADQRWLVWGEKESAALRAGRFPHADGRFHFRADWAAIGADHAALPQLPDFAPVIDLPTAERPFRLVTAPARNFLNTSFTETQTSRRNEVRPEAMIHPDDCAELGLADGGLVRIGNDRASVLVHVRSFAHLQRGVVVVESVWPNHDFMEGIGINALISADPGLPDGGGVFHDTAVWLRPG
jgi:anaerobic selenocysteine-containing dehydrogenase